MQDPLLKMSICCKKLLKHNFSLYFEETIFLLLFDGFLV